MSTLGIAWYLHLLHAIILLFNAKERIKSLSSFQDYSDEPDGVGTILLGKFKDMEIASQFANKLLEIVETLKE